MLQIRISKPDFKSGINFSDPIVLEMADQIVLSKTVNSSDESISFDLPLNDPKMTYLVPSGYLRWWECWDTVTGSRLNYGPIGEISRASGDTKKISGPGRSAALGEFFKSVQTFYYPIDQFFDDIRYENIAGEPRTTTIVDPHTDSDYYGLSKRSKDYVIDEQTGFITVGRDTPYQGTIKSDVFWSGIGKSDSLTVNLGEKYTISKSRILLPWWGGATINNDRTYDWNWSYSNDGSSFTNVYSTDVPNHHYMDPAQNGITLYFGESGFEFDQITAVSGSPIEAEYWKLGITDTHAWYGNIFTGTQSDEWDWECGQSNVLMGNSVPSPTVSGSSVIPTTELNPASDCHASAVELAIYRKIIDRDNIPNLAYHQIQDESRQITYYHVPDASEMISAGGGKKFEPGGFFRKVTFTASSTTIKDEYNTELYSGGSGTLDCPAYSRYLLFSDASAQVTQADCWLSKTDAFSYGGSYSYTTIPNDYAILHFRGISVKWFATIPEGSTAGQVSIELRSKDDVGVWSGWTTLEAALTLPTGINGQKVWEITPESGTLSDNTIYQLKITNLNGGYVGIDAFAGFWSASFTDLNQDDSRFRLRLPTEALQSYDQKFSFGSIYEYAGGGLTKQGLSFTGDRVMVYSRKGKDYGLIKIGLFSIPDWTIVPIPGGDADGSLVIDLNNTHEIPQAVIFDSDDYFTAPGDGLPWGNYRVGIYKPTNANPIWVDGVGIHETSGLSVKFINTSHLDILKNTTEALQLEWDITENGIKVAPRIGTDTDIIFAEGRGTTIRIEDVEDVTQIATMLISNGADIDGLPLSVVVEDKNTRAQFGRTIQRLYDFRNIGSYFTLIGAARTELKKRRSPQKRITITTVNLQGINEGDSFIAKTPDIEVRVRANTITRNQSSSSGLEYTLECLEWPQID